MTPTVIAFVVVFVAIVLALVARTLLRRRVPRASVYRTRRVEDLPDVLEPFTVYLAGEDGHLWAAALLCPCGCGERMQESLFCSRWPDRLVLRRNRWSLHRRIGTGGGVRGVTASDAERAGRL